MLFILNRTRGDTFDLIRVLGGEEDKSVLLVGDAVYYGTPFMAERLEELGVGEFYLAGDALEARGIEEIHPGARVVGYDEMAALIMDGGEKVVSI